MPALGLKHNIWYIPIIYIVITCRSNFLNK